LSSLEILLLVLLLIAVGAAIGLLIALQRARRQALLAYAERAESVAIREALEIRLQHGLDYLNALGESTPDALVILDDHRTVVWANGPAWGLFNNGEPAVGKTFIALVRDYELNQAVLDALAGNRPMMRQTAVGDRMLRIWATPVEGLGGVAVAIEDATELQRLGRARRDFIANISHELRTPLSVLRGEIEAFQDGVREPTPEAIAALHAEVMKLGRLVDDLYELSLSDLGALTYRRAETDLAGLLRQVVDAYRNDLAGRGIRVEEDVPADRPFPAFADPDRLNQLFSNLLENSLKYTEEGGRLKVRIARGNGKAVVDLEDSGPGVPEAELARLFDRLYRVEGSRSRATGGAGLGLAICRNIVEAHGGTIAAFPSSMGGLGVRVELPLGG